VRVRNLVVAVFLMTTIFPSLSMAQAGIVALSGTVTDPAGKPVAGASVTLMGQGLTVKTDINGKYNLARTGSAIRPANPEQRPAASGKYAEPGLVFKGGERLYRAENAPEGGLYTSTGRMTAARRASMETRASKEPENSGWNDAFPDLQGNTYGTQGAVSNSGSAKAATKADVSNPAALSPAAAKAAAANAGSGATVSAAPDSLAVLAIGYQRDGRGLASLTGTQDFQLKALNYIGVPYKTGNLTVYEKQMCTLDVHVPTGSRKKWPVIVHIHGGGLQEGDSNEGWTPTDKNNFVRKIYEQGYLIIAVNYRLGIDPDLPNNGGLRGKWPDYMQDAAAAVAWARRNVEVYGGDTANFFVMGYSAGAWQAMMLATDTTWYQEIGFKEEQVSGYIALSTHMTTYFEYAIEQNIPNTGLSIAAVFSHIRKVDVPIQLFVGGLEGQRITDNQTFVAKMQAAGTKDIALSVMPGRDHQQIVETIGNAMDDTRAILLDFLTKHMR